MHYDTLRTELSRHADPGRAVPMKAYMKGHFDFIGIAKPQLTRICQPFFKDAAHGAVDWHFIGQCWADPCRELQYCALEYLKKV